MQALFKYHFNEDSVRTQKVKPPNTNNKIGNAIFIKLLGEDLGCIMLANS